MIEMAAVGKGVCILLLVDEVETEELFFLFALVWRCELRVKRKLLGVI